MTNDKLEVSCEFVDWVYFSKNPFVRSLFWKRIQTAIAFGQISDDSIILDIGCHPGHLLKAIRKFNSRCECSGIDVEPKVKTLKVVDCRFQIADCKNLPFSDNYFNIVFALDTLEHIQDADTAIQEIRRVLSRNGLAILSGPTESWFYRFCRFVQFGQYKKNIPYNPGFERGGTDYHFHDVYDLEEKFVAHGFRSVDQKSLPGILFPELFRLTKYVR